MISRLCSVDWCKSISCIFNSKKFYFEKQCAPTLICCMNACVKQILRMIALSLRSLGPSAMFYLAAAVSDFYVPWESMVIIYFSCIVLVEFAVRSL